MRRYSQIEEESIRAQTRVREWTRAGLLGSSQRARLDAELRVDLKRTNGFLRAGLALFTGLIVLAFVLLVVEGLDLRNAIPIAIVNGLAAVVCVVLAETLTGGFRFYRFGVEESLAIAAVCLLSYCVASLVSEPEYGLFGKASWIAELSVGAAGGFVVYRRFGFVYAAIGGMACAAMIPFQMDLPVAIKYTASAAALAVVFLVARSKRLRYQDEYPGDDYGQLQAAALAGIYVVLNLQIRLDLFNRVPRLSSGAFYWLTYAMTWLLPILGLRLSIREKDRVLLDVSLAMALVTLLTNKPYLGWIRHTWDPMLLGVFLITVAVGVRRWLSKGKGGGRRGFTSARELGKDSAVLTLLSVASATFQPAGALSASHGRRRDSASPPDAAGGRSGGAGGGGAY